MDGSEIVLYLCSIVAVIPVTSSKKILTILASVSTDVLLSMMNDFNRPYDAYVTESKFILRAQVLSLSFMTT
jgi:hypothetical protein